MARIDVADFARTLILTHQNSRIHVNWVELLVMDWKSWLHHLCSWELNATPDREILILVKVILWFLLIRWKEVCKKAKVVLTLVKQIAHDGKCFISWLLLLWFCPLYLSCYFLLAELDYIYVYLWNLVWSISSLCYCSGATNTVCAHGFILSLFTTKGLLIITNSRSKERNHNYLLILLSTRHQRPFYLVNSFCWFCGVASMKLQRIEAWSVSAMKPVCCFRINLWVIHVVFLMFQNRQRRGYDYSRWDYVGYGDASWSRKEKNMPRALY
jgi:hypothetical protein